MSKPNLPPLPDLPEKEITDVICNDDGDEWPLREWLEEDLRAWATAYAEEAVRQALAAQVPVAWRYWNEKSQSWNTTTSRVVADAMRDVGRAVDPLYAAPRGSDEETRDG